MTSAIAVRSRLSRMGDIEILKASSDAYKQRVEARIKGDQASIQEQSQIIEMLSAETSRRFPIGGGRHGLGCMCGEC